MTTTIESKIRAILNGNLKGAQGMVDLYQGMYDEKISLIKSAEEQVKDADEIICYLKTRENTEIEIAYFTALKTESENAVLGYKSELTILSDWLEKAVSKLEPVRSMLETATAKFQTTQ